MAKTDAKRYILGKDEINMQIATTDTTADEPDVDVRCGYGSWKPKVLQKCNNPKVLLLVICIFTFSQGFVVNGINNVNTSSIERRFQLSSAKTGLLSSSYDFAAAFFGIIISFYGSGRHKARWVAIAAVVMGIGSFTMAVPHFTTGLYEWGQEATKTCSFNGTVADEAECVVSGLRHYLGVLMFGMMLHGIGGAALYTIGVGYIDDSVPSTESPFYLGCMYGGAALGPGIGYIVGGQLLNIYVDFDKVDTNTVPLKTNDPRWVGAWWVGFFFTMAACLLIAIPLSCYGAEMPSAKEIRESRESQMHKGNSKAKSGVTSNAGSLPIRQMPKIVWQLLKNPPFLLTMLAGASKGIITSGFATFVPKYIQNQFGVSAGLAAIYTGVAAVPGAAGGMFFGGYICKKFKLKVRGMLKLCIVSCVITIITVNFLWISCDEGLLAGINHPYKESETSSPGTLGDICNTNCSCSTKYYEPVCSAKNVQYFSPCFAGCRETSQDGETFSDCACAAPSANATVSTVSAGGCQSGCGLMYLFLVMMFLFLFFTFLQTTPGDAATLRCIHEDYRTFSMGIKWCVVRLLGTVPGPVIFGAVTDVACIVWQTQCGERSSCWIYDNFAVSRNYFLLAVAAEGLCMICFSLAFYLYTPPEARDNEQFEQRESAKRQMSFINGSFRASEYENGVLGVTGGQPWDRITSI